MNSALPHLRHRSTRRHWPGLFPGSPKILVSGICRTRARQIPRGFTLVEMAIAVFIIALLLGSILVPLTTQVEQRQVRETQKMLEDIKMALIGHAIAKGYLPCPDKTSGANTPPNDAPNDGVEDFSGANCVAGIISGAGALQRAVGNVPWATLGLGISDPWGNRFRYVVDIEFTNRSTLFNFSSSADLCVGSTAAACVTPYTAPRLTAGTPGPDGAVAVIISHGKNGRSAINSSGATNVAATSPDELDNVGGPGYTSRPITPVGSTAGEFDDIVTWLGKFTLFNRMVAADKLP
jgi:prepilin-type N-terminal cleavage/methylation domain-containing protein